MAAIDRIVINANGASQTMSPEQWKAMPLTDRVKLLGGDITFYAGAEVVPSKAAVASLR